MLSTRVKKWVLWIIALLSVGVGIVLFQNRQEITLVICQRETFAAYEGLLKREQAQAEFFLGKGRFAATMTELGQALKADNYHFSVESVSADGFLLQAKNEAGTDIQTMDENGILDHPEDSCIAH